MEEVEVETRELEVDCIGTARHHKRRSSLLLSPVLRGEAGRGEGLERDESIHVDESTHVLPSSAPPTPLPGVPGRGERSHRRRSPSEFSHIGLITTERRREMIFVAATRVWITDFTRHPYHVEWLRFEPDSPVTGPVREAAACGLQGGFDCRGVARNEGALWNRSWRSKTCAWLLPVGRRRGRSSSWSFSAMCFEPNRPACFLLLSTAIIRGNGSPSAQSN